MTVAATHPAFELCRKVPVPSLNLEMEEYRHIQTGAMHYHLAADNPENVFLVALRTMPMDSTGVAHILEHTALCGSQKYPVRDPFFLMIRRSLNTFMNAFTSSDWTAYPFASQNRQDFDNLLSVYLDAVFFARLDPLTYYGKLSAGDYEQMLGRRAEVQQGKANPGEQLTMSRVMGVAQRQLSVIGLDPKKDAVQLAQFQASLWNEVQRVRVATGKEPDDGAILGITRELLRNVEVDGKTVRGYQAPATAAGPVFSLVPKDAAKSIRASYAAAGKPAPTSQQLSAAYREGLRLGIFMPPEK